MGDGCTRPIRLAYAPSQFIEILPPVRPQTGRPPRAPSREASRRPAPLGLGRQRVLQVHLVPVRDVVDRPVPDVLNLVRRAQRSAGHLAQVPDGDRRVRPVAAVRSAREDAGQHPDPDVQPDLFAGFPDGGLVGRLVRLDPAARQAPASVIGAPDQQDLPLGVEDRRVRSHLRGDVSEFADQPLPRRRGREIERLAIVRRRHLE